MFHVPIQARPHRGKVIARETVALTFRKDVGPANAYVRRTVTRPSASFW